MYKQFPVSELQQSFALVNSRLVRRFLNGTTKPVGFTVRRSVYVVIAGKTWPIAHVAWALAYGTWPAVKIQNLAVDPWDLDPELLVPVFNHRLPCKISKNSYSEKFRHNLSKHEFWKWSDCRDDWVREAKVKMAPYKTELLLRNTLPVPVFTLDLPRTPKLVIPSSRPPKPAAVPGRIWYFYKNQWVDLPEAIHPSDDMAVRAEAILAGAVGMRVEYGFCVPVFPK